ncbi:ferric reductase-like transmembrane domain-containing protein [Mangrovibacterium sp.]|uniref:ferric reductase-like transmembrane domain-containing protein n=1 Tax=Mangrovibacterium sp. TaxID=1961364 RepID=UPI00356B0843
MENKIRIYNRVGAILLFIGLPVLLWALDDVPRRSDLKEAISVVTLVAYSLMLAQFYLARSNKIILNEHKMSRVVKWHKVLGYSFVTVLLLHPFLIVVPRYFESGITPEEAFIQLITSFDNPGVLLGLIAWSLMLTIGITSLFRDQLPMSYKTWRVVHGILSIVFIVTATWHAIDLGRHTDKAMMTFMLVMAGGGILLLLRTYFSKSTKKVAQ